MMSLDNIKKFVVKGVTVNTPHVEGTVTCDGNFLIFTTWPGNELPTGEFCFKADVHTRVQDIFGLYCTTTTSEITFNDDTVEKRDSLLWAVPTACGIDLSEVDEVGIIDGTVYSNCNEYTVYSRCKNGFFGSCELWTRKVYCDGQKSEDTQVDIVATSDVDRALAGLFDTINNNPVQVGELDYWLTNSTERGNQ